MNDTKKKIKEEEKTQRRHLTLNINANYYTRGNGNAKLVPVGANDV